MKVIIVYDSVSPSKVTMKVAQAIWEGVKAKGLDADCIYCKDLEKAKVKNYDCVIAGAPTMAFRPSRCMLSFLTGSTLQS
ncbi:MAG: hypothetical protein H5T33_04625 [Candidatus Methanosuratus sp.]|nr:hypothetical protein [Candidatus Methanosuratincola sp.]